MRWAQASVEKPDKAGQYYVWHERYGRCVMGFNGDWGPLQPESIGGPCTVVNRPLFWLQNDGSPHQAPDGSFGGAEVLT